MTITTPDWVKNAIFYQIFPDRFARSERMVHPPHLQFKAWGADPAEQGYQGGDLYGVVDKLDYLKNLGITALYLCPVFASAANHRYHTFDYYQVDPLLGGNDALRELIDEAHKRDIKIVLDGVFNHASRGFWQFHHILENGGNSPYIDWFIVHDFPLHPYTDDPEARPFNYEAWVGLPMLPKFNHDNPDVRQFIFDIAKYWIDFGIDGWRLDVPFEIDDDSFWQEFRTVVKTANPEAYIVGELWEESQRWLQGDQFDAVMNYIFAWSSLSFFGGRSLRDGFERQHYTLKALDAPKFAETIDYMHGLYDWNINHVQLNLIDSHDTARALHIMNDDQNALELTILHQMTMPGAPCIYYGTEVGLNGGRDPLNREGFPWEKVEVNEEGLIEHIQKATYLRNTNPVLRTGDFKIVHAEGKVLAYQRRLEEDFALVIYNIGEDDETVNITLDEVDNMALQAVWGDDLKVNVENRSVELSISARSATVLISSQD